MTINCEGVFAGHEPKTRKDGSPYAIVRLLDDTGKVLDFTLKDMEFYQDVQGCEQYKRYKVAAELNQTRYGLQLELLGMK